MVYVFRKKRYFLFIPALDAVGRFLFPQKKNRAPKDPRNVLVLRLDHIGDVLAATAVPRLIKKRFPGARVTFVVAGWGEPLLTKNPHVDETLLYNAPWFTKGRTIRGRGPSFVRLAKDLRRKRFDLALSLRGDLRENALMAWAAIPERFGYGVTGGGFWLTREADYPHGAHHTERTRVILEAAGIPVDTLKPELYFDDTETKDFDQKLGELGWDASARYAGLQIEAGSPAKNWPAPGSGRFMASWKDRFPGKRLVVVGGENKGSALPPDILDLRGKTTLRELCLLLRKLDLFIGPDSGPAHIASAVGVPTLFLYSGTNVLAEWRPLGERAQVLKRNVACDGCRRHDEKAAHACMAFEPETVFAALEKMIP